jgi:xylan 1,4-beta-xylosidase
VASVIFLLAPLSLASSTAHGASPAPAGTAPTVVTVDAQAAGQPFPHFWERMFGSGRAPLALRESYRQDLALVKAATGFEYVRFHAILHDDLGLYDVDKRGNAIYNFTYIDQIYDGLLERGVRPFVELSFMPRKLARDPKRDFGFWDTPNISPPKDYKRWDAMIEALLRHLVDRYGIEEVAQWYFEVWNEPNAGFWGGDPYQPTYFELYDHTARAIKKVSPRLRVGGPATAQAAWVSDFIAHAHREKVPVDFVSSHVYANDWATDVFGHEEKIPRQEMACRAVRKNYDEIKASAMPSLPLIYTEYNASYANEPNVTDTVFMGPWLAETISRCDGLTEGMSLWTFSDVFDEVGVIKTPFYGGYGIVTEYQVAKPALHAFAILHRLGTKRVPSTADSALITKRDDGTLVIALWNYAPPDGEGPTYTPPSASNDWREFTLRFSNGEKSTAYLWRVDRDHNNVLTTFDAMGRPAYPSPAQIAELRLGNTTAPPEVVALRENLLNVRVPAQGLAVVEIR